VSSAVAGLDVARRQKLSTSGSNPPIEPFYFRTDRPLFGCYHRPQRQPPRPCAIVLCHPLGDEYIRFFRALRQLAVQLAGAGFPVLRFDWYGSGDSSGEAEEWRLSDWQADLCAAIAEARRRSGAPAIALAGLHLGATLAAAVAAAGQDIVAAVLWDAVLDGKAYLQELQDLHTSMLRRAHLLPEDPGRAIVCGPEILGFPMSPDLRADIAAIDLPGLPGSPAAHILLVESNPQVSQAAFAAHLRELSAGPELITAASPQLWVWEEGVDTVIVPHSILQAITSWLAGVCP